MKNFFTIFLHNSPAISHRVTAYLACRSAVKAGDFLTPNQRQSLINKLFETPNRYTCPHGRPTMIAMDLRDFETILKDEPSFSSKSYI